jgi:hypothetical protein
MCVLSASYGTEWKEFEVDVTQEAFPEYYGEPDYLLPSRMEVREEYYLAQYIVDFSLSDDIHVVEVVLDSDKKGAFVVVYTRKRDWPKGKLKRVDKAEIDIDLAKQVYRVWVNTLLEVRYSRGGVGGLDGTTYHFSSFVRGVGWLHGETWSPKTDAPPKRLTKIGGELMSIARGSKRKRDAAGRNILKDCSWIMEYLREHAIIVPTDVKDHMYLKELEKLRQRRSDAAERRD